MLNTVIELKNREGTREHQPRGSTGWGRGGGLKEVGLKR